VNGILVVDKPKGITSHDVVDFIRRHFRLIKVGHAGTLDPIATGVLVLLIGDMTKRSAFLSNDEKEYEAKMVVGARSDTGDADGVLEPSKCPLHFTRSAVEEVLKSFTGEIRQVPPMYSAIKFKGQKLYQLARRGVTVERAPRSVTISSLSIKEFRIPEIVIAVTCSKGTYIRQLGVDIGEKLGCGAYLADLRRIRSGTFRINEAVSFATLERSSPGDIGRFIYGSAHEGI